LNGIIISHIILILQPNFRLQESVSHKPKGQKVVTFPYVEFEKNYYSFRPFE